VATLGVKINNIKCLQTDKIHGEYKLYKLYRANY